jgi:hypothetical protein
MKPIDPTMLSLDQLKALVANHERLKATDTPLYREAKALLDERLGPAGMSERVRASRMARWTREHGKDDAANPWSKGNMKR